MADTSIIAALSPTTGADVQSTALATFTLISSASGNSSATTTVSTLFAPAGVVVAGGSLPVSTKAVLTTISSGGSAVATSTIGSTTLFSVSATSGNPSTPASLGAATSSSSSASTTTIPNAGLSTGAKAGIGVGVAIAVLATLGFGFLCLTGRIAVTLSKRRREDTENGTEKDGNYSKPELEATEKREERPEAHVSPAELPGEAVLNEAPNPNFGEALHEVSSREVPAELSEATPVRARNTVDR